MQVSVPPSPVATAAAVTAVLAAQEQQHRADEAHAKEILQGAAKTCIQAGVSAFRFSQALSVENRLSGGWGLLIRSGAVLGEDTAGGAKDVNRGRGECLSVYFKPGGWRMIILGV